MSRYKNSTSRCVVILSILMGMNVAICDCLAESKPSYVVVVSRATQADSSWAKVVDSLVKTHQASVETYDQQVAEVLPALTAQFPKYVCFIATPQEAGREFVATVHRLTRKLDDDPYTDVLWGIITGYDAANALLIAETRDPLIIKSVASGTELAMDRVVEGVWYCELEKNRMERKVAGGEAKREQGPNDTTEALATAISGERADLFVTSGHATERDWQIGFRYRNGYFRSQDGKLLGVDTADKKIPIHSDHPKVYLPVGNCLMGHIDGTDSMAIAFMNSVGVRQMIGYTVPTWYGYAGWGELDYFVEQPGRYTFAEAFFANEQALIERLNTNFPEMAKLEPAPGSMQRSQTPLSAAAKASGLTQHDGAGLLHDRDVLAFYGDPAWEARMAPGKLSFEQSFTEKDGLFTLEIKPLLGEKSFATVNNNGSQRGGRPFVQLLPTRLKNIQIVAGQELSPVITDNFVLIPNPRICDPNKPYRVVFTAEPIAQP